MDRQLFQFEQSTLFYTKTGTGKKSLFLFHGFGQKSEVFIPLSVALSDIYIVYSFNLFFHAGSTWGYGEQPLEKEFWKRLLTTFLNDQQIQSFSVLGFSMGGKFAMATVEAFPERVKEIFLLAPDGIKTSMWYSLATYPIAFRNLFKSMVAKPERLTTIVNLALRTGLIDKGILRFVESQMNTEEKRNQVYYSWVVFRHLKFNMDIIAKIINQNKIKLVMIIGKFDKIITVKNMDALLNKVDHYKLELPETGHNDVIEASINILKNKVYSDLHK